MEYFNDILCVSGSELIQTELNPNGLISKSLWDKLRKTANVVRRGCNGQSALIEFKSLPMKYRNLISEKLGNPTEQAISKPFKDKIIADGAAVSFYSNYKLDDSRNLPADKQREYAINAAVLNAVKGVFEGMRASRSKLGGSTNGFWKSAIAAVNDVRVELKHGLPSKEVPLMRTYKKYIQNGYKALISGKYCNDNSRKVDDKLENLIMSLYTMPNKPFAAEVHTLYLLFLTKKLEVIDRKTGEIMNAEDFYQNGEPITITKSTVWNCLNLPHNRAIVDRARMGAHRYNTIHRPHHHRHAPTFSFSKVSLDDRDLPRKCVNGKWVKAYYAYDVTSGCVVGFAHSLYKNEELFLDCLRDMFKMIEREGYGVPMQVEVENHLVNKFFEDLEKIFPFVRVCTPGNSQEKRAEHFNRAKKYGVEMKTQSGIGRWWSKHEAYTVDRDRKGDEMVERNQLPYERLVADDLAAIKKYNNQPHPKQKKYPGKTRLQVLQENMNPNTHEVNKELVYRSIGYKAETSIQRNHYVTVIGAKYQISGFGVLEKLKPGNYNVEAYYLPDDMNQITEVYLYQDETFLCKAEKIATYNESLAERTAMDFESYKRQGGVVAEFDAATKGGKKELASAVIIESETLKEALEVKVEEVVVPVVNARKEESLDDMLNELNKEADEQNAEDSL